MVDFKCRPIDSGVVAMLRTHEKDGFGNGIRKVCTEDSGLPCRQCLENSRRGDVVLLASFDLPRPKGLYWTPSPIFIHAEHCQPYDEVNHIPEIVRGRLVSLRSYDAGHQCIYDLGAVVDGDEAEGPLRRALADERTQFVNIHTAKPGCLLCTVDRL